MNQATKYLGRYLVVVEASDRSYVDISELQAWADKNDQRINVRSLLIDSGHDVPDAPSRYYVFVSSVANAAGKYAVKTREGSPEVLRRLAGIEYQGISNDKAAAFLGVANQIKKRILCAIYDGHVRLFDNLGMPLDISVMRKAYEERSGESSLDVPVPSNSKRTDQIGIQIASIAANLAVAGNAVTPTSVMTELKKSVGTPGSCVFDTSADETGVLWRNGQGVEKVLDMKAVKSRLARARQNNKDT